MKYNVYCDESCHLEHDDSDKMVLGCIWLPRSEVGRVSREIRELKKGHGFSGEIKWTKVSPGKIELYRDIVEYFFSDKTLCFRCVVVRDKTKLKHEDFNMGSHDTFYYKMFYQAMQTILATEHSYHIYLDLKDTRSITKVKILHDFLCNKLKDSDRLVVPRVQQIRSHESVPMQLCDLLIGAVAYSNRGLNGSTAKVELVQRIEEATKRKLIASSSRFEQKFNVFQFDPQDTGEL